MRPITGDCSCGRFFLHPKRGALRIYCEDCSRQRSRARNAKWDQDNPDLRKKHRADWYVRVRKNNPKWAAKNKKIAKRWRAANAEHIRAYQRAYREARA
jgi:hypothetical protein